MRHFLLALLIALLPLRGWVGDAMALSLVGAGANAQAVADGHVLADCMEHSAAVHAALHAALTSPMEGDATAHHGTSHPTADADEPSHAHGACEVCNGPAMALDWPVSAALPPPQALARTPAVRFASTVLPQGVKPPIS